MWAVFQPAVGWIFIGTGLYAWRRRPDSRTGALMVAMGFAWLLAALEVSNSPLVYTFGLVAGGLFGAVFLHLGMSFPTGWLEPGLDRKLVIAGYLIFPLAFVPALFFAGPHELRCDDCPANLLLIDRDETLAAVARAFGALLYASLFVLVLIRAVRRWRLQRGVRAPPAHAGVRERAGRVPRRHRGPGHRDRDRPRDRRRDRRAAAVHVPRQPAAHPRLAPRRRAAREPRGAARLARADRARRRRRAPAARARPPRRRAVAAGRARPSPTQRAHAREGRSGARGHARPARRRSCRRAWESCASWRAGSTRPS